MLRGGLCVEVRSGFLPEPSAWQRVVSCQGDRLSRDSSGSTSISWSLSCGSGRGLEDLPKLLLLYQQRYSYQDYQFISLHDVSPLQALGLIDVADRLPYPALGVLDGVAAAVVETAVMQIGGRLGPRPIRAWSFSYSFPSPRSSAEISVLLGGTSPVRARMRASVARFVVS